LACSMQRFGAGIFAPLPSLGKAAEVLEKLKFGAM
jgi:hypothetical protein